MPKFSSEVMIRTERKRLIRALGDFYPTAIDLIVARSLFEETRTAKLVRSLEEMFLYNPGGFYRHYRPALDQEKLEGRCWKEELGISRHIFRKLFDTIGVSYSSVEAYNDAGSDKFKGKFYARVLVEADNHRTYYYRNTSLINEEIRLLMIDAHDIDFDMGISK